MAWFKVDDEFPEHVKLEKLEDDPMDHALAVAAWTLLGADGSKPARAKLGGVVTFSRLKKVLPWPQKMVKKAADALVSCGLWEPVEGGYRFHDWSDYQPDAEEVEVHRSANTERQKRWRQKQKLRRALAAAGISMPEDASIEAMQRLLDNGKALRRNVTVDVTDNVTVTRDRDVTNETLGETLCHSRARDTRSPARARDPVPTRPDPSRPDPRGGEPEAPPAEIAARGAKAFQGAFQAATERWTGFSLMRRWGEIRAEVLDGLPWTIPRSADGKAEAFAERLGDAQGDVEPTMRLALELIRDGAQGWRDERMRKSATFAFASWMSGFTELREQLHRKAPRARSVASRETDETERLLAEQNARAERARATWEASEALEANGGAR